MKSFVRKHQEVAVNDGSHKSMKSVLGLQPYTSSLDHTNYIRLGRGLQVHISTSISTLPMAASPHNVEFPLRQRTREAIVTTRNSPPAPGIFPSELLLLIARCTEDTEDLQRLRLVSRAFNRAATTALQDRFTRIYIMPLQSSLARFTRLTMNPLIGPKISRVNVIYEPPTICHVNAHRSLCTTECDYKMSRIS